MPVLIALPLWAVLYGGAFGERASTEETPVTAGATVYRAQGCSGCHGPTGGGGVGPALAGGDQDVPELRATTSRGSAPAPPRSRASRTAPPGRSPRVRMPGFRSSRRKRSSPSSATSGSRTARPIRCRRSARPAPLPTPAKPVPPAADPVLLHERSPRRPRRRRGALAAPHAPIGWPRPATTSSWSRRSASRARRPAATGSPPGRSSSSRTWAWPTGLAATHHRYDGLRSIAFGLTLELQWPAHPDFPDLRLRRHPPRPRPDGRRAGREGGRRAVAGDRGHRARRRGRPGAGRRGQAQGRRARPRRCGPATSSSPTAPTPASAGPSAPPATEPTRWAWPSAATSTSPRHDEPWIESHLDLRDKDGNVLPGYGWIFPVGDGRVNVGVGLLSTFNQWKSSTPPT